jgi:gamma-glutamylcyclotransferase (GGCT)/AIG2-like uncharacterized protein YtfP
MGMEHPFFFGYGSLVNRATHDYRAAHAARVTGWRRAWKHTLTRPVAYLTAVPDETSEIDGLIAEVPRADWVALDQREHAYDRVRAAGVSHPLATSPEVHIYWVPDGKHEPASHAHPILLSYLDVVVQGYLREFGEAGVERFFRTTDGWEGPVLNDRLAPRYPRHQPLSRGEHGLVDAWLAALSVEVIDG